MRTRRRLPAWRMTTSSRSQSKPATMGSARDRSALAWDADIARSFILLWTLLWACAVVSGRDPTAVGVASAATPGPADARIPRVERRTFLVLSAAALGSAGCTAADASPSPPGRPPEESAEDPDAAIRRRVADSEVALIAAYARRSPRIPSSRRSWPPSSSTTRSIWPGSSRGRLRVRRLPVQPRPAVPRTDLRDPRAGTPPHPEPPRAQPRPLAPPTDPAPRPTRRSPPRPPRWRPWPGRGAAQHQRASACDGADDAGLARDLCLIAASEAQHAECLDRAARRGSDR